MSKIKIADHIANSTYSFVQDPKLLMRSIENIFLALTYSMGALLHYERMFKRVPMFKDTFEDKIIILQQKVAPRYNIDREYMLLMRNLKEIILDHHNSPVEFVRGNELMICDDDYKIKKIDLDLIRGYISKSKSFLDDVDSIISKNKSVFSRKLFL
ncbi:MAG: hypothetical protein V1740_02695 [Candidatus Woesearchaeota archaeon]